MAHRSSISVSASLAAIILMVPPNAKAAQVLPAATFVEVITASPTNTGQVSGRFDDVPEIISFDETVTSNGNFVARYISEARTSSIGTPTADVQGDGVNVLGQGLVRSADIYKLVYSPGIVIPEPSTVTLVVVGLPALFGLAGHRSPRRQWGSQTSPLNPRHSGLPTGVCCVVCHCCWS